MLRCSKSIVEGLFSVNNNYGFFLSNDFFFKIDYKTIFYVLLIV